MYTVSFHPKVQKDFSGIDEKHIAILREAIHTKLAKDPIAYGKPLRHTLKNLRSLRVGEYRIIYTMRNGALIVLVLIVGKRDSVYKEAMKRLGG